MIVVDSSVWIDHYNGRTTPQTLKLEALLGVTELLVGDIILCEVLQGARSEAHSRAIGVDLAKFDCVSMLDPDLAVLAAANYRKLRGLGVTIRKTVDLVIGTCCLGAQIRATALRPGFRLMETHLGLRVVPMHLMVHEPPMAAYGAR